jgi:hypothetical protein
MSVRAFALIPAGWWLQHHLRVRRHDQRAASYAQTRASNWLSPPRRSRRGQCDGERITKQHHEREQGSRARCQCRRQAIQPRSGWARPLSRSGGRPSALYGLPTHRLALTTVSASLPRATARRWVQQQRHDQDEIPEHILVADTQRRRQIADRIKVGLDLPALALDGGLFNFQVGKGLRLDRELVGKAVALGLPSRGGAWRSATCSR